MGLSVSILFFFAYIRMMSLVPNLHQHPQLANLGKGEQSQKDVFSR
jgi:hypothetical protein